MIGEKPFIHLFNTAGGYYIYDVNTNKILRTKKDIYDYLHKSKFQIDDIEYKTISSLMQKGFLSSNRIKDVSSSDTELLGEYLDSRLKMIVLQITQQCNLRCEYCVYSGNYKNRSHSNKKMDFETARKGIDFLIAHSSYYDTISVGFYGGEPLLEFELVKKCIDYAKQNSLGRKVVPSVTTNGTLLNKEILEYFALNKVNLIISIDGPKEIHDSHRKFANGLGSFDKLMENIEMMRKNFPDYLNSIGFSIVIDAKNNFKCMNEFFTNYEGIKEIRKHPTLIDTRYSLKDESNDEVEDYMISAGYELFKLFLSKLNKLDEKYTSQIVSKAYDEINTFAKEIKNNQVSLPVRSNHGGPCIPGTQRLFMNVEGTLYPCERVSEDSEVMKIGHIDTGFDIRKAEKILNFGKITESKCINCWAFKYCKLCAACADELDSFSAEKVTAACPGVISGVEETFKNYCTLKEFGHDFDEYEEYGVRI